WQAKVELSARLMQAQRSIRHVPPAAEADSPGQEFPPKCSLLGSYEQMGPAGLDDSREFWEQASKDDRLRLREGERFCAIALVKRFCGPWFFVDQLDLAADDLRYEDTATVAAAKWLKSACIDPREIRRTHREHRWSGQWLHWPTPDFDPDDRCPQDIWDKIRSERRDSKAPAYYSVLMMDGDNLGDWLRGENSPLVGEIMHPDLVSYYRRLTERSDVPEDAKKFVHEGLRTKRPVGPALHAAISEALANFALHFVPNIVARHGGTLIYAGGDDVLALLPTTTSLACALELRDTFRADWKTDESTHTERLLMGSRATVSAGLAVVHYKEDLRFALDEARKAEKTAKDAGRDALQITVCRRSGEHATALCPWGDNEDDSNWTDQERFSCVRTLQSWIGSFIEGASDRWAFHLRGELPTLQALPEDAMKSEIRRQINHAEEKTREAFPPDAMSAVFGAYRQSLLSEKRRPQDAFFTKRFPTREEQDRELTGRALKGFITLCQSASFLARGRDE
ncbi:MAG: type III-B CRISPR-associated protein Cas10/Cmr2, partial [Planctomycetes bacterium]|nr:type III-B CRISPR-associated protein Cas10/Cmr2 [Planctomycetota bacterium]